jgi:hypothetical protein
LYWADQSSQGRIKVSCTGMTSPTRQPKKDPFHLYALSPHSPQFQRSAGATPLWSLWVQCFAKKIVHSKSSPFMSASASRSAVRYLSACQYSPFFVASQRHALVTFLCTNSLLARNLAAGRRCSQYWTAWDAGWLCCTGTLFGGAWAGRQARTGTTCCAALEINLDWDG